jgi:hypothetical protein
MFQHHHNTSEWTAKADSSWPSLSNEESLIISPCSVLGNAVGCLGRTTVLQRPVLYIVLEFSGPFLATVKSD